jgi:hypothetical protein
MNPDSIRPTASSLRHSKTLWAKAMTAIAVASLSSLSLATGSTAFAASTPGLAKNYVGSAHNITASQVVAYP